MPDPPAGEQGISPPPKTLVPLVINREAVSPAVRGRCPRGGPLGSVPSGSCTAEGSRQTLQSRVGRGRRAKVADRGQPKKTTTATPYTTHNTSHEYIHHWTSTPSEGGLMTLHWL